MPSRVECIGPCLHVQEGYIWGGYANIANYPAVLKAHDLYMSQTIIWDKRDKQHPVLTRKDYMGAHEWCFYGWKLGAAHQFFGPHNATDLWAIKKVNPQSMVHLTEKPVELALRALQYSSRRGENVLDLFGGSGSTLIAAEQTERRAYLVEADIILSTTGAPEPIVTRRRFDGILTRRAHGARGAGTVVILDISVPRDFDPRIHDGDRACLFNIDDLQRIPAQTLEERKKYVAPAEALISQEVKRFMSDWMRRRRGPVIARLTQEFETRRHEIVGQLLAKLSGKLTDADKTYIEGAFRLLQNQFLHGPISALAEETPGRHTLREALRKLFWLEE